MKIEQFIEIEGTVDLVNTNGGSDSNSTYVQNLIHEKVRQLIAGKESQEEIDRQIEYILEDYEILTKKLEEKTETMMKEKGFSLD